MIVENTSKEQKSLQHRLVGKVVSNKMTKTVTVLVERRQKHPIYGKYIVKSNKYHAHDETDAVNEGDVVEIAASRPLSRTKTWTVTRVVKEAVVI
ncbi:MAG TPA: 30S ribosomal protein S17 [Burkholderiaceae bacterium]|jgi:small subunit ribosomal protein S17|nr:30S ribosomal protein S17 [Burkholderiaceae bacterium]